MKVYQVFYKAEQKHLLNPNFIPYYNHKCSKFFENEIIVDLINYRWEHIGTDYFGVVSHNLMKKIPVFEFKTFNNITLVSNPDVLSFMLYEECNPIDQADVWHPGFKNYFIQLLDKIGYKYEDSSYVPIYSNCFVAKSEVYEKYVVEMLLPAMWSMERWPELMQPCEYPGHPFPEHLKKDLGIDHWPWHPFLLERLFGYFCQHHKLNVKYY